jgi:hypothetical protein
MAELAAFHHDAVGGHALAALDGPLACHFRAVGNQTKLEAPLEEFGVAEVLAGGHDAAFHQDCVDVFAAGATVCRQPAKRAGHDWSKGGTDHRLLWSVMPGWVDRRRKPIVCPTSIILGFAFFVST